MASPADAELPLEFIPSVFFYPIACALSLSSSVPPTWWTQTQDPAPALLPDRHTARSFGIFY